MNRQLLRVKVAGVVTMLLILLLFLPGTMAATDKIVISADIMLPFRVAVFTVNVTEGTAPLAVQFTDTSTGNPSSWAWVFGDGDVTGAALQNPVHTYTLPGIYRVNLTASNATSSNTTPYQTITVYPTGDFNRNWRVDIGDVTSVAYMAVHLISFNPAADFTGDGYVDVADASKIAWYYVGKIPSL